MFLLTSSFIQPIALIDNDTYSLLPNSIPSWFWSSLEILSDTSTLSSYVPDIAIDSEDNIHVVWYDTTVLLGSGGDQDVFYRVLKSTTKSWSAIELVSSESTSTSASPVLATDSDGNVHVAWYDWTDYLGSGTDRDLFYKKKTAGGMWTTTEVVSTDSTETIHDIFSIDVDTDQNVYFAWSDPTDIGGAGVDHDIFLRVYNSTASTWKSTTLISDESTGFSLEPDLDVNSLTGDVHLVWEDLTDLLGADVDSDIFYRRWNVFSSSLSEIEIVTTTSTLNSYHPKLELGQNSDVHVIWDDRESYYDAGTDPDIYYKKLSSTSDSWGITELVSSESSEDSLVPDMEIADDSTIFVAWYDYEDYLGDSGSDFDIFFKYKDPSSNQWSLLDVVSTESDGLSHTPRIAIDSSGFLSCVWNDDADLDSAGTDADIFYREFAGIPSIPLLYPIIPNPSALGNISLNWKEIQSADIYLVYRSTTVIDSVYDLQPVASVTDSSYFDTINETGVYYYAVVAKNGYGTSAKSNVEDVEVTNIGTGIFGSLDLTEILILVGIVVGLQIIGSAITYALVKGSVQTKGKPKKRKKK
ncbi:MAG: hypothetical protein ACXAAM_06955 [Candidatus Heimdallarchaeaceae archaeon]